MQEIERKFLLLETDSFRKEAFKKTRIVQGYLNSAPERTVRVRIKGDKGFITVKGLSNDSGASRFEWEKEIPVKDAEVLLPLCESGVIEKYRYEVNLGEHVVEVDEFLRENEGLFLAEIELKTEEEVFQKPQWLGEEVTGKQRYYNSNLIKKPYKTWKIKT